LGILSRMQAIDDVFILVDKDAAAGATIRTDAFLGLEEPDPLLVEEILAAQCADRTEIDHVASQLVVQGLARKDVDLGMIAPVDDLEFCGATDLTGEADAARTHDAADGEQSDRFAR